MRICANIHCKKEIPEGQQVVVWDNTDKGLTFFFVCPECSKILEEQRAVEDITNEIKI